MELRDKILARMGELGMNQAKLAAKTKLSTGHISQICSGEVKNLRLSTIRRIASALSLSPTYLIDNEVPLRCRKRIKTV